MAEERRQRKRAVAIKGAESDTVAPTIAAKGAGSLADKIIAIAREHGIPVKEDPDLVAMLARLDLERALPPELYPLIAELLGFAYKLNKAAEQKAKENAEEEAKAKAAGATEQAAPPEKVQVAVEAGETTLDELPTPRAIADKRGRR